MACDDYAAIGKLVVGQDKRGTIMNKASRVPDQGTLGASPLVFISHDMRDAELAPNQV